jgi:vanillate O-demethylase ferredoxin subunit
MTSVPATIEVRVTRKADEAEGICSFELRAVDGRPLPAFCAGSHVDVHVPGGLVRQYSLCNDPAESHRYLIAVLKDPASRGGSAAMHERVQAGDTLAISAPKNHFALAHDAAEHLLLAGGIGITPLLCMAERLAVTGAAFTLHYATRSRARTAFADRIAASPFAARVRHHFDDGDAAQRLDLPRVLGAPRPGCHLYVCGPQGFMDAVLSTARAAGWPEAQLHWEFFGAAPVDTAGDGSFEVQLASSGRVIVVARDQSVTQALEAAGVIVPTSCEQGVCGTCVTRVLAGVPDHRDLFLTPDEQAAGDQFTPCCSRAKSPRLVLDL